jgi:2-dehydro-3-deoxygluconokinase
MGKKVVTLGEIMLRLSTPGNTRFVQSDSFDVVYGGGEANVAVSCANYGHDAYFVTKSTRPTTLRWLSQHFRPVKNS